MAVLRAAMAASAPEIVALTANPGTSVFEAGVLPAAMAASMKSVTWHAGCPVPLEDLRVLRLSYWNFGGVPAVGTLVVNKEVAAETIEMFRELFRHGFLIERMRPVDDFGGSDDRSMAANNTSAFNCRDVTGQPGKFSNHSWGRAIDINPLTNPYVKAGKVLPPAGSAFADRTRAYPGSILADGFAVRLFEQHGWTWGGSWKDLQDFQHFEKPVPTHEHSGRP